jgi:hypothetical protein
MIKEFFRLTKESLIAFILFYLFLVIFIAIATGGFFLKSCPSCPPSTTGTFGFYAMILAFSYILFCWINHVWKKVQKLRQRT